MRKETVFPGILAAVLILPVLFTASSNLLLWIAASVVIGGIAGIITPLLASDRAFAYIKAESWKEIATTQVFLGMCVSTTGALVGALYYFEDPGSASNAELLAILLAGVLLGGVAGYSSRHTTGFGRELRESIGETPSTDSLGSPVVNTFPQGESLDRQIKDGKFYASSVLAQTTNKNVTVYKESVKFWAVDISETSYREPVESDPTQMDKYIDSEPTHDTVNRFSTDTNRFIRKTAEDACQKCGGSGKYCINCGNDNWISCSNIHCENGTIEHECGCHGTQKVKYGKVAQNGEIADTCPSCEGDGKIRLGSERVTCDKCDGAGEVVRTCPACGGSGIKSKEQCESCGGSGTISCPTCTGGSDRPTCNGCEGTGRQIVIECTVYNYFVSEKSTTDEQKLPEEIETPDWKSPLETKRTSGLPDLTHRDNQTPSSMLVDPPSGEVLYTDYELTAADTTVLEYELGGKTSTDDEFPRPYRIITGNGKTLNDPAKITMSEQNSLVSIIFLFFLAFIPSYIALVILGEGVLTIIFGDGIGAFLSPGGYFDTILGKSGAKVFRGGIPLALGLLFSVSSYAAYSIETHDLDEE